MYIKQSRVPALKLGGVVGVTLPLPVTEASAGPAGWVQRAILPCFAGPGVAASRLCPLDLGIEV